MGNLCRKYLPGSTKKWEKISEGNSLGCSGYEIITCMERAYAYGGLVGDINSAQTSDKLRCQDFALKSWTDVVATGDLPGPRASYAMCTDGMGRCYIIGGINAKKALVKEMYVLNLSQMIWSRITSVGAISERALGLYGQSVDFFENNLYSFGGREGLLYCPDMFRYDICLGTWSVLKTEGDAPSPRCMHRSFAQRSENNNKNRIFIVGGDDGFQILAKIDVYMLDIHCRNWEYTNTSGKAPVSRFSFSSCFDEFDEKFYIFGGLTARLDVMNDLHCLDVKTKCWSQIKARNPPTGRAFHSSCCYKGAVYIFGGTDRQNRYDDSWMLQLSKSQSSGGKKIQDALESYGSDEKPEFQEHLTSSEVNTAGSLV